MPQERELEDLFVPDLAEERAAFSRHVIGQEHVAESFASLVAKIRSGIRSKRPAPIDVKFLLGPSGVGKTTSVFALAQLLCADFAEENGDPEGRVLKIDAGDYKTESSLTRLIGSPPSYRGSKDTQEGTGGIPALFSEESLSDYQVKFINAAGQESTVLLLLVDEIEKADESLQDALLSIMDRGYLRLADNTMADFTNAAIFFTSNIGNDRAERKRLKAVDATGYALPEAFDEGLRDIPLDPVLLREIEEGYKEDFKRVFRAEFRNRRSELLVYRPLTREQLRLIAEKMVAEIAADFEGSDPPVNLKLNTTPDVLEWLVDRSYDLSAGARALAGWVEMTIGEPLKSVHGKKSLDGRKVEVLLDERGDSLVFKEEVAVKQRLFSQRVRSADGRENPGAPTQVQ